MKKLDEIRLEIDRLHSLNFEAIKTGLDRAKEIGCLLLQAKKLVPQGGFHKWIADNCSFKANQAKFYMRIEKEWNVIAAAKEQSDVPFNLRRAEEALGRRTKYVPLKDGGRSGLASLKTIAESCHPSDLADLLVDLVKASPHPQAVAERVLPELQRIKNWQGSKPCPSISAGF